MAFATACALGFTIVGVGLDPGHAGVTPQVWWTGFQANMVVSLTITLAIRGLFWLGSRIVGRERLRDWNRTRRSIYFTAMSLVGVSIGWPLGMKWAFGVDLGRFFSFDQPGSLVASVALAAFVTLIFHQFFAMKTRQIQAENRATEAHFGRLRAGQPDRRRESVETGRLHLDIMRDLKRVNAHLAAAAYPVLEDRGELLPSRLRQDG